MKITAIYLSLPPSLNHAYITRRGSGQRMLSSKGKAWIEASKWQIRALLAQDKPFEQLSVLQLMFFWPDKRIRDYDNHTKLPMDALKGTLIADDSCWNIKELHLITGGIDKENPRIEVTWVE